MRHPAVEPAVCVFCAQQARIVIGQLNPVVSYGQRSIQITVAKFPPAQRQGTQVRRGPAGLNRVGINVAINQGGTAVGIAQCPREQAIRKITPAGVGAVKPREVAFHEGHAIAVWIGARLEINTTGPQLANFAIGEEAIAAAPDEIHIALYEALVEIGLAVTRVDEDGVLIAVHVGVVADKPFGTRLNHQREGLRPALRHAVGQFEIFNRDVIGPHMEHHHRMAAGVDKIAVGIAQQRLLTAFAPERDVIFSNRDIHNFDAISLAQKNDAIGGSACGDVRQKVHRALHGTEIRSAVRRNNHKVCSNRRANWLGGELPGVRRRDADKISSIGLGKYSVVNYDIISLVGGHHARMRIDCRRIAGDDDRESYIRGSGNRARLHLDRIGRNAGSDLSDGCIGTHVQRIHRGCAVGDIINLDGPRISQHGC